MADKSRLHSDTAEDVATASNFRDVHVTHYSFFFDVRFDTKTIHASVKLECVALKECNKGETMPYMYTGGQAVMTRSFFPCQDTPAVKSTFSANVKVPDGFTVLMSGNVADPHDDLDTSHFASSIPIPAYLIAMAVGNIEGARIGPRSMVYAEPCVLERAKNEFDGLVESFIATGERLFGPYVWGRYDILIMPPLYLYGGAENACLTFLSPCLISGDQSIHFILIHEVCHSWFGNMVTNVNWCDFWMKEGFSHFAARRIIEELYGSEYRCVETSVGQALLEQLIRNIGEDHPLSRLRVVISPGVNPEDTYNETPYEKGFCFASYLQHLVGDKQTFDGFLRDFVETFKYRSITAEDLLEYFLHYFPSLKEARVDKTLAVEFDQWLNKPGRPLYQPDLSAGRVLTDPADKLVDQFLERDIMITEDMSVWHPIQVIYFLDRILDKSPISGENMQVFIKSFPRLDSSENCMILTRWFMILIRHDIQTHFHKISDYLHSQGNIKNTVPIYMELMKGSDVAKKLARDVFESAKLKLHSETRRRVKEVLNCM